MEYITMSWIRHNKYWTVITAMASVEELKQFITRKIGLLNDSKIRALKMVDWERIYQFTKTI